MPAGFGRLTFTVEVDYTDRSRTPEGRYVVSCRTVEVRASDDVEAVCVAAQIVDTIRCNIGGMVLATRIVGVSA